MKHIGIRIVLFIVYFVSAALLNSVGILVERSQEIYGVSKPDAAVLEPFKDISIAVIAFLIGSFLPKIGHKKGMLIALVIVFLGCIGMYVGNSFWAVKILFACTGISFAIVKVAIFALIGEITDSKEGHSSLMNLMETFFMLGIIFMYVVFPLFYSDTDPLTHKEVDPNAWLRGYLLMAGLIFVSFLILLFSKFDIEHPKTTSFKEDFKAMLRLLTKPLIGAFAIFAFLYVMTEQGIMTWLPTFNKETLKLDAQLSSQMAVILMLSSALGRFLTSMLVKYIKWIYIASICALSAIILVFVVLPLAENVQAKEIISLADLPVVSYLFPLIGLFLAPIYPLINSTVLSSTVKSQQTGLAGLLVFFSALGGTIGSLLIGNLFDKLGGDKVFYLSLIPITMMLVTFFFINKLSSKTR